MIIQYSQSLAACRPNTKTVTSYGVDQLAMMGLVALHSSLAVFTFFCVLEVCAFFCTELVDTNTENDAERARLSKSHSHLLKARHPLREER